MAKIITTGVVVLVILGLISAVVFDVSSPNTAIDADILYWGTTCPNCHDTIDWIKENKIDEKITVVLKEVYGNQQNSDELVQNAKECGIEPDYIGIPLLYTVDGECLMGTPDISKYLSEKVGGLQ